MSKNGELTISEKKAKLKKYLDKFPKGNETYVKIKKAYDKLCASENVKEMKVEQPQEIEEVRPFGIDSGKDDLILKDLYKILEEERKNLERSKRNSDEYWRIKEKIQTLRDNIFKVRDKINDKKYEERHKELVNSIKENTAVHIELIKYQDALLNEMSSVNQNLGIMNSLMGIDDLKKLATVDVDEDTQRVHDVIEGSDFVEWVSSKGECCCGDCKYGSVMCTNKKSPNYAMKIPSVDESCEFAVLEHGIVSNGLTKEELEEAEKMKAEGKEQCPKCGKWFKNIKRHTTCG